MGNVIKKLMNAPPGYVGYEGGRLTNAIKAPIWECYIVCRVEKA